LSRIGALVIARRTAFAYKEKAIDAQIVGSANRTVNHVSNTELATDLAQ
jgi:TolB-like protein